MNTNTTTRLALSALTLFTLASTVACSDDDHGYVPPYSSSSSSGSNGSSSSSSGSSGSTGDEHPSWLVGPSYTKGYKTENNIAFESEDSGIKFDGAPDYKYEEKIGKSWTKKGTWKVESGNRIVFSDGGSSIDLSTAMKANCRILTKSSSNFYTSEKVEGCPFKKPLSSSECDKVGYYSKGTTSGGSSSSSSTSTSYQLDPDGVLIYTTGRSSSTCYGSTCKTLVNTSAPVVGRWWLSGSTVQSDASASVSLTGFEFSPDTDAKCPN